MPDCADPFENPPTELSRCELAHAAFRWVRGPAATRYKDPAQIAADRAFDAWWEGELYAIAKRGSLRLLCEAAWNASVARPDEYAPGDGFSRWWRMIVTEAIAIAVAEARAEDAAETMNEIAAQAAAQGA